MTTETFPILSALIDRESVDPEALGVALENPDGRQLLVDFIRLREQVSSELRQEEPLASPRIDWPRPRRYWRLTAAALLPLIVGIGSGYWWSEREQRRPPAPTRVMQFVPGVDWK